MRALQAVLEAHHQSIVKTPPVNKLTYRLSIDQLTNLTSDHDIPYIHVSRAVEIWHRYISYHPEHVSNPKYLIGSLILVIILSGSRIDLDQDPYSDSYDEALTVLVQLGGKILIPSIVDVRLAMISIDSSYDQPPEFLTLITESLEAKQYDYGRLAAAMYLYFSDDCDVDQFCYDDEIEDYMYYSHELKPEVRFLNQLLIENDKEYLVVDIDEDGELEALKVVTQEPLATIVSTSYTVKLGKGAAGSVKTNTRDALKSQPSFEAFVIEVGILRTLSHPNLVTIKSFAFDPDEEEFIYTMPTARGSLQDQLDLYKHKYEDVKWITRQLAAGLDCLHSNGILHLDLKPANILVYNANSIRIADLGLAKCYVRPLSFQSDYAEKVTLYYRDIRLLEGSNNLDAGVDIWSLGIVALDCVTGDNIISRIRQQYKNIPDTPAGLAVNINNHILTGDAYATYPDEALVKMWKQIFTREARSRPTARQVLALLS